MAKSPLRFKLNCTFLGRPVSRILNAANILIGSTLTANELELLEEEDVVRLLNNHIWSQKPMNIQLWPLK